MQSASGSSWAKRERGCISRGEAGFSLWRSVELNGCLDSSSNKMPVAVKGAISYAVEVHGGRTVEDARAYVDGMIREGRLLEECWS